MTDESQSMGPSLSLLWRLAIIPAVLLTMTVVGSIVLLLGGAKISDDRISALWVLVASLVATLGAFIGALLTASSQRRAAAMEEEGRRLEDARIRDLHERDAARSRAALESQKLEAAATSERLSLEATTHGVRLLEIESANSSGAASAGAFSIIVELGSTEVALRMLGPSMEKESIDPATAVWVIDRVLDSRAQLESSSKGQLRDNDVAHAAFLLLQHASDFTSDDVPGAFQWPASCTRSWPPRLTREAGGTVVLYALADVLTSRDREWWGEDWEWAYDTLLSAYNGSDDIVAATAAAVLGEIFDADRDCAAKLDSSGVWQETAKRVNWGPLTSERRERIRAWMLGQHVNMPHPSKATFDYAAAVGDSDIGPPKDISAP